MPPFPHTAGKTHAPFQPRYPGLDAGSKPPKTMIHIFTAAHICFFKTTLFGKANVFDLEAFGLFQILLGCKTTVKTDLKRETAIDLFLPFQHRDGQIGIGWVAFNDATIQDQIGSPSGQAYFVSKIGDPTILNDDIGVWFKDRHHLVVSRHALSHDHTPVCLIDHLLSKLCIMFNFAIQRQGFGCKALLVNRLQARMARNQAPCR